MANLSFFVEVYCRIAIRLCVGHFENGRERYRTVNIRNVRRDVTADEVAAVVRALAPLLDGRVVRVRLIRKDRLMMAGGLRFLRSVGADQVEIGKVGSESGRVAGEEFHARDRGVCADEKIRQRSGSRSTGFSVLEIALADEKRGLIGDIGPVERVVILRSRLASGHLHNFIRRHVGAGTSPKRFELLVEYVRFGFGLSYLHTTVRHNEVDLVVSGDAELPPHVPRYRYLSFDRHLHRSTTSAKSNTITSNTSSSASTVAAV